MQPFELTTCPSPDEIASMLNDRLERQALRSIEDHIETCTKCHMRLSQLSEPATNATNFKRAGVPDRWHPFSKRLLSVLKVELNKGQVRSPNRPLEDRESHPAIPGYELTGVLGRGGMGIVYDAVHRQLNRPVAIKILPKNSTDDREQLDRFGREMVAIGQLNHPNIVQAFDASEYNGMHFLVMERVNGTTVSDITSRIGTLRVADACELIRQAAIGLQHAHDRGLVHRDIKPSNLMLSYDGVVKILDLGLARTLTTSGVPADEITSTGQIVGTIDFMSPEQVTGSIDVGPATDIYSLGATLYRLIAGAPVFPGDSSDSVISKLRAIAEQRPEPLAVRASGVPKKLSSIVDKMLAKKPNRRFHSANDLIRAMEGFANEADLDGLIQSQSDDHDHGSGTRTFDDTIRLPQQRSTFSELRNDFGSSATDAPVSEMVGSPSKAKRVATVLFVAILLVCFLAAYVLEISTDDGTLVIRSKGDAFKTSFRDATLTIKNTLTGERHRIKLDTSVVQETIPSGAYLVVESPHGLTATTNHFKISNGDEHEIEVWWNPQTSANKRSIESFQPIAALDRIIESADSDSRLVATDVLKKGGVVLTRNPVVTCNFISELPDGNQWTLIEIRFNSDRFGDEDMMQLATLKDLNRLVVFHTRVTESGYHLLRESSLKSLAIGYHFPPSALDQIAQISSLEGLDLEGIGQLKGTRPFQKLKPLKSLTNVSLHTVPMTTEDLADLNQFSELRRLYCASTGMTDDAVPNLVANQALRSLVLERNPLSDKALDGLAKFKTLDSLIVNEPAISDQALRELKRTLPAKTLLRRTQGGPPIELSSH